MCTKLEYMKYLFCLLGYDGLFRVKGLCTNS